MRAQKWGTLPHAHSGAPKMLKFTHKDPNLVLHLRSRTSKSEYPHRTKDCGYFA